MTKKKISGFETLGALLAATTKKTLVPPRRVTVSQWAEETRQINQPGAYVGPWRNKTTPYLTKPMDMLTSVSHRALIFVGPAQCGKALALDTDILTPSGWRKYGDIEPGDFVFAPNGHATKVVARSVVWQDHRCADVIFDDGSSITADAEHLWVVDDLRAASNGSLDTECKLTTQEIHDTLTYRNGSRARYAVDNPAPAFMAPKQLPIDPYLLGLWLGDGHSLGGRIYCHTDDADFYQTQFREWTIERKTERTCEKLEFRGDRGGYFLLHHLRDLSLLRNKHVPELYFSGSIEQRWALVQGLMDSDGCALKRGCAFTSTNHGIAESLATLLRSLGVKCHLSRDSYHSRVRFVGYRDTPVFRLPRKLARLMPRNTKGAVETARRYIRSVVWRDSVPVRCIQVDHPSSMFVAGRGLIPTHNTEIILNWTGYSITTDPQDMMIYSPTFTSARDFSMRRIDRLQRHTPVIKAELMRDADSDNKFDKHYQTGMMLTLTYPSVTELAGRPVGRIAMTDFDRMAEDVGGDGNPFDLATKRTTTFGSYAMTLAESSPSRDIAYEGTKRVLKGHEAPPTTGILALYNRGDRHRWVWPCPHCGSYFEGTWDHMKWDSSLKSNMAQADSCYMECPECSGAISVAQRNAMNRKGVWIAEGQEVDFEGTVFGEGRSSNIASFWLKGVAAGLTTWSVLVKSFLDAMDEYNSSGDETSLKKFFNTDLGETYIDRALLDSTVRLPETIQARAEFYPIRHVPKPVRFLLGIVDVQKNHFVVQIIGVAPGTNRYDLYLVDRFTIRYSDRIDPSSPEGKESYMFVRPGAYLEDWEKIISDVIEAQYPLDDDSGRYMSVKMTFCDSGGEAGVTTNAYNFYRQIKAEGYLGRFHLVKGDKNPGAPRARITYPDADKKSKAGARGEIPLLLFNPTTIKDDLDNRLDIVVPGEGMIHFPAWLTEDGADRDSGSKMEWFYSELTSEVREAGKGWVKVAKRNEAWDLFYYAIGACASSLLNIESVNWEKPPPWADEWDSNPLIVSEDGDIPFAERDGGFDWSAMGRNMG